MPSPFWPWQKAQPDQEEVAALRDLLLVGLGLAGLGRREGGVQGTGQQQAEQQHRSPANGSATVA